MYRKYAVTVKDQTPSKTQLKFLVTTDYWLDDFKYHTDRTVAVDRRDILTAETYIELAKQDMLREIELEYEKWTTQTE